MKITQLNCDEIQVSYESELDRVFWDNIVKIQAQARTTIKSLQRQLRIANEEFSYTDMKLKQLQKEIHDKLDAEEI